MKRKSGFFVPNGEPKLHARPGPDHKQVSSDEVLTAGGICTSPSGVLKDLAEEHVSPKPLNPDSQKIDTGDDQGFHAIRRRE